MHHTRFGIVLARLEVGAAFLEVSMFRIVFAVLLSAELLFVPIAANANDELIERSRNPKDWVMPAGNYVSATRNSIRSLQPTLASYRSRGRSRPACCAGTKADR